VSLIVDDEHFPDANPFVDAEISGYTGPLVTSRWLCLASIGTSI